MKVCGFVLQMMDCVLQMIGVELKLLDFAHNIREGGRGCGEGVAIGRLRPARDRAHPW